MDVVSHMLNLFITFLHELGHVTAAIITGGYPIALQVNPDGSGLATTSGGIRGVIEAGGYIGSIIFGNLMVRVGILHPKLSRVVLVLCGVALVTSSILLHSTGASFIFTMGMGVFFLILSKLNYRLGNILVVLMGAYSIIYIINDFNVGPTSDLQSFSGVIPAVVWMYVWLAFAVLITIANAYTIFIRRGNK